MYVIGTAGHVDHGKSTLVEALTGIDPDRLREEKEREMTIDLGFAWLQLGAGEEVGVVDVPGHRDFIENMLAGVGGIDLALFVVAADEGVMPQTREHLAILDLLNVGGGIVALTKTDLIDDPDWLELVILDLHEALADTVLAKAPIVPVSAKTGAGLDELRELLWQHLSAAEPRSDLGRPRLPVDRVFSLSGFGTVVTGTLLDGRFRIGDPVELQPSELKGRVRGLQTHKTKLDVALPGSRVAINISGVDRDDVRRGFVVAAPGVISHTILLDASYRHLADASGPLKHNMEVKLFVGAAEVLARTRILGAQQINPGETGWLQLALTEPIATARRDRFILRRPSPGETLGGGLVLDPHPGRRHRRFRADVVARLETLAQGTPADLLLQTLRRIEPTTTSQLLKQSGMDEETAVAALAELETEDQIITLEKQVLTRIGWQGLLDKLTKYLQQYHRENPLRLGMPREELRSRLQLLPPVFNPLVQAAITDGLVVEEGTLLRQPAHHILFSAKQETAVSDLLRRMSAAGVVSPSVKDCKTAVGDDVYFALLDLGKLKQINNDVVYATPDYERFTGQIIQFLQKNGEIDAAQTRDLLKTSRKYAIALLEHLDDIKVTKRVEDKRVLR
ncbi:MAG: selenocysteine-specific translation elongation factor [Anaerolineae bacterium]|nr:selenocysteine-specific translation elongation factor [Anaerolineae bacterium]